MDPVDLHEETQQRVNYELSADDWPAEGSAEVLDRSGQLLLTIAIEFLRQGMVNNFAYVLQCVHMAYVVSGGHMRNEQGVVLDPLDAVTPGQFVYWNDETASCTPRIGPRFKFRTRPPHPADETSTMSNSTRSSANQSQFREALLARDGTCLISEERYRLCTPSHILPLSRPEYYQEVLGTRQLNLFEARFGLLLQGEIHHAFDRGHIALYPLMNADNDLVVHIFVPDSLSYKAFHGKLIRPSKCFRGARKDWPDTQLLLFHYQQCVIRCLRGWSYF